MGWVLGALSWGQIDKRPRLPQVGIHLSATLLTLDVAWASSCLLYRKAVEWAHAGHTPLTIPQGSGLVVRGDHVGQTGLVGLLFGAAWSDSQQRECGSYCKAIPIRLHLSVQVYLPQEEHTTGSVRLGVTCCPHYGRKLNRAGLIHWDLGK